MPRPKPVTLEEACFKVAGHFHGVKGEWTYLLFQEINTTLFEGQLPWPHISWALTPYGSCLGYSYRAGPPAIVLHPSLLGGSEKHNPWKVPSAWLGWRFAADVLLHEAIHLSVIHRLGGWSGPGTTSHNNPAWVAEVNRLLPLLRIPGVAGLEAGMTKLRRVPADGELSKRGKPPTRVERVGEGNLPFKAVSGFPGALRQHLHQANAYYQGFGEAPLPACDLPLEVEPPSVPKNR